MILLSKRIKISLFSKGRHAFKWLIACRKYLENNANYYLKIFHMQVHFRLNYAVRMLSNALIRIFTLLKEPDYIANCMQSVKNSAIQILKIIACYLDFFICSFILLTCFYLCCVWNLSKLHDCS